VIDAAPTLKRHEVGLMPYFAHRVGNAGAEGRNPRIQAVRVSAGAYRNREHFKTAIWFHLGGLQLYPATPRPGLPTEIPQAPKMEIRVWPEPLNGIHL